MEELETARELKLHRLKKALAEGVADLAAGRFTTIKEDDELAEFFARL